MLRSPTLALILLFAAPMSLAAEPAVIGYVDMQQILDNSAMGRQAQEKLKKQFEPQGEELGKEEQAIRQLQQTLERDKPLMSKKQVEKKEAEIQQRIEGFQKKAMEAQQALIKEQQKLGAAIIGPAREAVTEVAKQQKIPVVLERNQSGVLYLDEALNITDDVIKIMDKKSQ